VRVRHATGAAFRELDSLAFPSHSRTMLIMRRRDFLRITGAAAAFAQTLPASETGAAATVLYDDRAVTLARVLPDSGKPKDMLLSDEEFARRTKPRSAAEMEAEACFKLGVWFQQNGKKDLATRYFENAQRLNPNETGTIIVRHGASHRKRPAGNGWRSFRRRLNLTTRNSISNLKSVSASHRFRTSRLWPT